MTNRSVAPNIRIQLDSNEYFTDDCMKGTISIQINEPQFYSSLTFIFRGTEECEYLAFEKYNGLKTIRKNVANHHRVLAKWEEHLMPGNLEIPFNFHIPDSLPGTFERFNCRIHYWCEVVLQAQMAATAVNTIILKTRPDPSVYKLDVLTLKKNRKIFKGCSPKGCCTLKVSIPQYIYFPQDVIPVEINVDLSTCKVDIQYVTCILLRTISKSSYWIKTEPVIEVRSEKLTVGTNNQFELLLDLFQHSLSFANCYSTCSKQFQCFYAIRVTTIVQGSSIYQSSGPKISLAICIRASEVASGSLTPSNPLNSPHPISEDWNPEDLPRIEVNSKDGNVS